MCQSECEKNNTCGHLNSILNSNIILIWTPYLVHGVYIYIDTNYVMHAFNGYYNTKVWLAVSLFLHCRWNF